MALKNKKFLDMFVDFFEIVFIATSVFILIYLFVGQLLEVTGQSMYPNYKDKEQIIAEKISINYKDIERGEVIIFKHPDQQQKLIIKRVIALPSERIMIKDGLVYINEEILNEPYLPEGATTEPQKTMQSGVEYLVSHDSYIVMGDNREKSTDSRSWGAVSEDLIVGRGLLVYYPIKSIRLIE